LIEMQLNSIHNMVSKALCDGKISASEYENILSRTRKRNETFIKFDVVYLEIDKMLPNNSELLFRIND